MMTAINTAADIRTYVCNASPANVVEFDETHPGAVDTVAQALRNADHPAYGSDWSEWLAEHAERIAIAALADRDGYGNYL